MDTIEKFLSKTGKLPADRVPVVAALLYKEGQGFANALQLEGIQESTLWERYPGIYDGEVLTIVQAARPAQPQPAPLARPARPAGLSHPFLGHTVQISQKGPVSYHI